MSEYDHARNSTLGKDATNSCEIFVFLVSKSVLQLLSQTFIEAVSRGAVYEKAVLKNFVKLTKKHI